MILARRGHLRAVYGLHDLGQHRSDTSELPRGQVQPKSAGP
jgi:hypothetical protein